ncbi:MAG: hybrid sensor histidine kinase/response regulator [Cyanobacteria bacterium P01_F01_bin.53]
MTAFSTQHLAAPLHILLIEDDEGDRDLALEYLKADSNSLYQVTWADSLEAGLHKLESTQFDAIILDLVLPDSRGVTTVSKLCARSGNIPVIVSSYFDENALASKVIELGAQDYLAKDLMDSQSLGRTMSRALARAKHQTAQLSANLSGRRLPVHAAEGTLRGQKSNLQETGQASLADKIKQLQADIHRLEAVANDVNQVVDKQALDEARQRMVTTLSHECRSPATVILLASNILKSYDQKIEDAQYLKTLARIDDAVKQMMTLLDSAMNLQRAQSLVKVAKPQRFDLQALSRSTIAHLSAAFTPLPQIDAEYMGDFSAIYLYQEVARQVLLQLLTNAIQYSEPRSPISLTIQKLSIQNQGHYISIQVKDQGRGIAPDDQAHVFEAFYRTSHVENIPGIGLGLTMVKTCVDMCGGHIQLESEVDKGTTVTVTLPVLS